MGGATSSQTWGQYGAIRRCVYGRDSFEYVIEYAEQFFDKYDDVPKFFDLSFLDQHELSGEVVGYLDVPIANFLERMYKKG